ncbi:hypothetical protein ACFFJX_27580 [Pseudarcicella hirudinis]|uniref:hypothetical protein n=1 Tax=Pseudarcicella hirudinis TaxID=1079859 RepID=UPI0035E587D0
MILGGIDLSTYGIIPIQNGNGNIALQGCFDMPARIGKTYHEWQDENGIEPYVRSDEIRFGGRDIKLTALMAHEFENDLLRRLYQFYDAIQFNSLITLETDYGNYDVYLKDEIKAEYYNRGLAKNRDFISSAFSFNCWKYSCFRWYTIWHRWYQFFKRLD